MTFLRLSLAAAGVALGIVSTTIGAWAQDASKSSVVAGCSSGADCAALITAYVAGLSKSGVAPSAVDAELTDLTVQLGAASQNGAAPAVKGQISAGITQAANLVTDPDLKARLLLIAVAVLEGDDIPQVAASAA